MDPHEYCNEREEKALTERDEARKNLRRYVSRYHKLAMDHDELERRYALLLHQAQDFVALGPAGQAEAWRNGFAMLLDQFNCIDTPDGT